MTERKYISDEPQIVNPWEFLAKRSRNLEIGALGESPNIDLLKFFPTLEYEVGLVYKKPRWFVIKASDMGIPSYIVPENSDIVLHSHPALPDEKYNDGSIPSIGDYLNSLPLAKEFIASQKGITQYWSVEEKDKKRLLEAEMHAFRFRFGPGTITEYLKFLEEINAKFVVHPWGKLNNEKLELLFKPN